MQSGAHNSRAPGRPGNFVRWRLISWALLHFYDAWDIQVASRFWKICVPLGKLSYQSNLQCVSDISTVVDLVTVCYGLDGPGFLFGQGQELYLQNVRTGCDTRLASYSKYTGCKAAGAWSWPLHQRPRFRMTGATVYISTRVCLHVVNRESFISLSQQ
jgi:hypothetical protein